MLNNKLEMPQLGFGVFLVPPDEVIEPVRTALDAGYRLIDTATLYDNEEGVGRAIRDSGVPRDELFVTTKVWNDDQGYDSTLRAFDNSQTLLGIDVVDLYLIHWRHRSATATSRRGRRSSGCTTTAACVRSESLTSPSRTC